MQNKYSVVKTLQLDCDAAAWFEKKSHNMHISLFQMLDSS
jgi:hypothetical protein